MGETIERFPELAGLLEPVGPRIAAEAEGVQPVDAETVIDFEELEPPRTEADRDLTQMIISTWDLRRQQIAVGKKPTTVEGMIANVLRMQNASFGIDEPQDLKKVAREAFIAGAMNEGFDESLARQERSPQEESVFRRVFSNAHARYSDMFGLARRISDRGESGELDMAEAIAKIPSHRRRDFVELVRLVTPSKERSELGKFDVALTRGGQDVLGNFAAFSTRLGIGKGQELLKENISFIRQVQRARRTADPIASNDWLTNTLLTVTHMLPHIATIAATTAAGGTGGGVLTASVLEQPELYDRLSDAGVRDELAVPLSIVGGGIVGAIEFLQVGKIIPGLDRAVKRQLSRSFMSSIARGGVGLLKRTATETAEEGFQAIASRATVDLGRVLDTEVKNPELREALRGAITEGIDAMRESAGPLGVLSLVGSSLPGRALAPRQAALTPAEIRKAEGSLVASTVDAKMAEIRGRLEEAAGEITGRAESAGAVREGEVPSAEEREGVEAGEGVAEPIEGEEPSPLAGEHVGPEGREGPTSTAQDRRDAEGLASEAVAPPTEIDPELSEEEEGATERAEQEKDRFRLVSRQAFERALKRHRRRLGRAQIGIDPGEIKDLGIMGAYYLESGIRKFGEWSKVMIREFGEAVKPHLKEIWTRIREQATEFAQKAKAERGKLSDFEIVVASEKAEVVGRSLVRQARREARAFRAGQKTGDPKREARVFKKGQMDIQEVHSTLADAVKDMVREDEPKLRERLLRRIAKARTPSQIERVATSIIKHAKKRSAGFYLKRDAITDVRTALQEAARTSLRPEEKKAIAELRESFALKSTADKTLNLAKALLQDAEVDEDRAMPAAAIAQANSIVAESKRQRLVDMSLPEIRAFADSIRSLVHESVRTNKVLFSLAAGGRRQMQRSAAAQVASRVGQRFLGKKLRKIGWLRNTMSSLFRMGLNMEGIATMLAGEEGIPYEILKRPAWIHRR
jgi:hypothetical protein